MAATPNVIAEIWLATQLGGDSGTGGVATLALGGVHANVRRGTAGQAPRYPYVVFQHVPTGRPLQIPGGVTLWTELRYSVRAVLDRNDQVALDALVARIDARLHLAGQAGPVAVSGGGTIISCMNAGTVYYFDEQGDRLYLNYGALYDLKVQS